MSFADLLEHMAGLLAGARRAPRCSLPSLAPFDRAQPFTSHYCRVAEDSGQDSELGTIPGNATPYDVTGPIRYAIISDVRETPESPTDAYAIVGLEQHSLQAMRGLRMPFVSRFHCRLSIGLLHYSGTYEGAWYMASYHPRERRWIFWGPKADPHAHESLSRHLTLALGAQFTARYEWHAYVAMAPGKPRVAIPCTAKQAQKLFRTRDIPPGAARRAALRHWVGEHFRARLDGTQTPVIGHYRGVERFDWSGMTCELIPPAFDREKAAEAAAVRS